MTFPLDRLMRQGGWERAGAVLLLVSLPALALLPASLPIPLAQWASGLAPAAFGLGLRWRYARSEPLMGILVLLSLSAIMAWTLAPDRPEWGGIWLGVMLVALPFGLRSLPSVGWTQACAPISFLIYLVHPAIVVVVWYFEPVAMPWVQAPLILGLSLAFAVLAWRTGLARWLL